MVENVLNHGLEEEESLSLLDFLEGYPDAVKEQFMQGARTLPKNRQAGALQMLYSPVAPSVDYFYDRVAHLLGPNLNKMWRAQHESHNRALENLGVEPQDEYQDVTRQQLAAPLSIAGSIMRGSFYSPVMSAILKSKQNKATGKQWLEQIRKEGGRKELVESDTVWGAMSPEENTITGTAGFGGLLGLLEEEADKEVIDARELISLYKDRRIPLQEVVYAEVTVPEGVPTLEEAKEFFGVTDLDWDYMSSTQRQAYVQEIQEDIEDGKYKPGDTFNDAPHADDLGLNLPIENAGKFKEVLIRLPESYFAPPSVWVDPHYNSSPYGGKNVLLNIRMNEGLVGGEKALLLQEVESTWHQKAAALRKEEVERVRREQGISRGKANDLVPKDWAYVPDANGRVRIPDGPYKKTWHILGFKRALMQALRDPTIKRFVWTDGDTQLQRAFGMDWATEVHPDDTKFFFDLYDKKLVQFAKKVLKQTPVKVSSQWEDGQMLKNPDNRVQHRFRYREIGNNLWSIDLEDLRKKFKVKDWEKEGDYGPNHPDRIALPVVSSKEEEGAIGSYA